MVNFGGKCNLEDQRNIYRYLKMHNRQQKIISTHSNTDVKLLTYITNTKWILLQFRPKDILLYPLQHFDCKKNKCSYLKKRPKSLRTLSVQVLCRLASSEMNFFQGFPREFSNCVFKKNYYHIDLLLVHINMPFCVIIEILFLLLWP